MRPSGLGLGLAQRPLLLSQTLRSSGRMLRVWSLHAASTGQTSTLAILHYVAQSRCYSSTPRIQLACHTSIEVPEYRERSPPRALLFPFPYATLSPGREPALLLLLHAAPLTGTAPPGVHGALDGLWATGSSLWGAIPPVPSPTLVFASAARHSPAPPSSFAPARDEYAKNVQRWQSDWLFRSNSFISVR